MMSKRAGVLIVSLLSLIATGRPAAESNGVTTGELIIDPPTLINLGFEWLIDGDDSRNATVEVSYRKQGDGPRSLRRPSISTGWR